MLPGSCCTRLLPTVTSSRFSSGQTDNRLRAPDALFRRANPEDAGQIQAASWIPRRVGWVAVGGVVARLRILFHYNRPYGDIYMVGETFESRIGTYLVQELKRLLQCAKRRAAIRNIASRQTSSAPGFVPCRHVIEGTVSQGV